MTVELWKQVEILFESATAIPVRDRQAFLERECQGNEELIAELDALLSRDVTESDTIDCMVGNAARYIADTVSAIEGALVGPYRILRMLGEGGMGTVYEAVREDAPSAPHVALKLVKPGTLNDSVRERFQNERQILGSLENSSIARLLGGGEWRQREGEPPIPYIVMELVDGENICDYCDRNRLSVRARLALFLEVLDAVSFAHQNMVVHRDLKPSNILVTNDGTPHLLDFGIAKLIGQSGSKLSVTPVMTPAYASPEQLHGGQVNTTDDVYSLGLVLFELLTGVRARATSSRSLAEVYRAACDQPIPLPSEAAPRRSWLRGALDAIVSTCLKKDAAQRYASVEALARDVRSCVAADSSKRR
jgi:serine/threonine protein kinase